MAETYILDSSAMESINNMAKEDATVFDRLNALNDADALLFCDTVKDECRSLFKGETIAAWISPVFRHIRTRAAVVYEDCQAVMAYVPDILDDEQDESEAQALRTMALAFKIQNSSQDDIAVISDEVFTIEDRCTVGEACLELEIQCIPVEEFLCTISAEDLVLTR